MLAGYGSVDDKGELDRRLRKINGEFDSYQGELSQNKLEKQKTLQAEAELTAEMGTRSMETYCESRKPTLLILPELSEIFTSSNSKRRLARSGSETATHLKSWVEQEIELRRQEIEIQKEELKVQQKTIYYFHRRLFNKITLWPSLEHIWGTAKKMSKIRIRVYVKYSKFIIFLLISLRELWMVIIVRSWHIT